MISDNRVRSDASLADASSMRRILRMPPAASMSTCAPLSLLVTR
jgi:hypothetical protein